MAAWDVWADWPGVAGQAAQLAWAGLGWLAFVALKEAGVASVWRVQGGDRSKRYKDLFRFELYGAVRPHALFIKSHITKSNVYIVYT